MIFVLRFLFVVKLYPVWGSHPFQSKVRKNLYVIDYNIEINLPGMEDTPKYQIILDTTDSVTLNRSPVDQRKRPDAGVLLVAGSGLRTQLDGG